MSYFFLFVSSFIVTWASRLLGLNTSSSREVHTLKDLRHKPKMVVMYLDSLGGSLSSVRYCITLTICADTLVILGAADPTGIFARRVESQESGCVGLLVTTLMINY